VSANKANQNDSWLTRFDGKRGGVETTLFRDNNNDLVSYWEEETVSRERYCSLDTDL
jgi:hypothetical protein